jgi:hypothetical protein
VVGSHNDAKISLSPQLFRRLFSRRSISREIAVVAIVGIAQQTEIRTLLLVGNGMLVADDATLVRPNGTVKARVGV